MATTPQDAVSQVAAAFLAHWNGETAVADDNVAFDPASVTEFVRFSWQPVSGDQVSLGALADGVRFRRTGRCYIQIFAAAGQGLGRTAELEELALSFFETYRGTVWFRSPASTPVGVTDSFFQTNVSAQFLYDSIRVG